MHDSNADGRYAGYLTAGELRLIVEALDAGAVPTKNAELALPSVRIKRDQFTAETRGAWGTGQWPDRRPVAVAAIEGKRDDAPVLVPNVLTGGHNSRTFAKACEIAGVTVRAMFDPIRSATEMRTALASADNRCGALAAAVAFHRNHEEMPDVAGESVVMANQGVEAELERIDRLIAALQEAGW